MKRTKKERYTTYFFPSHLAGLKRVAEISHRSLPQVLAEAVDSYLVEVGALEKRETLPVSPQDIKKRIQEA